MSIPSIEAPNLLMFVEAARLLQQISVGLVEEGKESMDLPGLITEAIARAETQLEEMEAPPSAEVRQMVKSVLQLSAPEEILALLQRLVNSTGGDVAVFLERGATGMTSVVLPRELLYGEVLQQLCQKLSSEQLEQLATGGQAAIAAEIDSLNGRLEEMATERGVEVEELVLEARQQLQGRSGQELLELLQELLAEVERQQEAQEMARQAVRSKESLGMAGPLVFVMIAKHLIETAAGSLSADRRLDLQVNLGKAEQKLAAMERMGKVDNPELQRQLIQELIDRSEPQELMAVLDEYFVAE